LEEDDALFIVLERRRTKVFDDEWPCCRDGLEADVRVVEIGSGILNLGMNLIVEASVRCDRPLADR